MDRPGRKAGRSEGTSSKGTSFEGTSFEGTSFEGTSFEGTSFEGTSFPRTGRIRQKTALHIQFRPPAKILNPVHGPRRKKHPRPPPGGTAGPVCSGQHRSRFFQVQIGHAPVLSGGTGESFGKDPGIVQQGSPEGNNAFHRRPRFKGGQPGQGNQGGA
ncbi:MAG: pentapeptide repeat-containing protein [Spirochaetaceae bacterium]|nr:pentapeptide repeat-containing protein [Spirochaetaceae bacterium]